MIGVRGKRRAAAAIVIAVLVTACGQTAPPVAAPITTTAAATTTTTVTEPDASRWGDEPTWVGQSTSMRFGPAWLPDGFTERSRSASPSGIVNREWSNGPFGETSKVSTKTALLTLSVEPTALTRGQVFESGHRYASEQDRAAVGDARAYFTPSAQSHAVRLHWTPTPDVIMHLSLTKVADPRATALRIAGSMRPDDSAVLPPLLELPAEHARRSPNNQVAGDSPQSWRTSAEGPLGEGDRLYRVELSPDQPQATGGTSVRVRGREGTFAQVSDPVETRLVVRVHSGRFLTIAMGGSSATVEDLVTFAEQTTIGPPPDLSWIGSR